MEKINDKKAVNKLIFLFAVTYMISYITRINYGAVIAEMESATGMSRSLLSMALTGSFITYGAGQIISGFFGDRFSPKKLILIGLISSSAMNILLPLCNNAYLMLAVWCVNGFAQSFMWPPLVKLMATLFDSEDYKRANVKTAWGSSCGTIAIYLISPLLISHFGWKYVFFFSAACGIIMAIFWQMFCKDIEIQPRAQNGIIDKAPKNILFSPLLIGIMAAIIFMGMLRDGVTAWMPSYISDTYKLSSVTSILTGVVMPIFAIVCYQVVLHIYRTKFKNPLSCAALVFSLGAVSAMFLIFLSGSNAAMSVVFLAMLTGSMHGVNLMLIGMLPGYFQKYGNVSTVSGILNSCTYVGAAVSTYGIAFISENLSWNITIIIWFAVAIIGTSLCFILIRPWRRFNAE